MIGPIIYILCAITCIGAAILLWRGFRRSGHRLLFWSSLCFAILAASNGVLILDLVVFPDVYLLPWRTGISELAFLVLIYGLIFESD